MMKETSPEVYAVFYYYCAISLVKLKEEFVTIHEVWVMRKFSKQNHKRFIAPHLVFAEIFD